MLTEKIKKLIQASKALIRYQVPPISINCVPCEAYQLNAAVKIHRPLNGCSSWEVLIDNMSVGRVEGEEIDSLLQSAIASLKAAKIASL